MSPLLLGLELGFIAPYGVQPGLQVGASIGLTERVFVRPQLGVFARPGVHVSGMADLELGLRSRTRASGLSASASLGLGYVAAWNESSQTVHLGSGASSFERSMQHSLIHTVNGELTWLIRDDLAPFLRLSTGPRAELGAETSLFVMAELGLRFGGAR